MEDNVQTSVNFFLYLKIPECPIVNGPPSWHLKIREERFPPVKAEPAGEEVRFCKLNPQREMFSILQAVKLLWPN